MDEQKIILKPWGQEEILAQTPTYMLKRLTMWQGHKCSLQYHNHKTETIYVLSGKLNIEYGDDIHKLQNNIYQTGESVTICAKTIHRMTAVEDSVYLEASDPFLDDVVRLQDDYNRV